MAQIAPVGPKSFYEHGLVGLKTALEEINGSQSGMLTLISGIPADIESCWDEVGAGTTGSGTRVLAQATLESISDLVAGDSEPGSTETGWKLVFDAIPEITGSVGGTAIAMALIVGRETLAHGIDADVRYIIDIVDLAVTPGIDYSIPTFSVEINYGENKV